MARVNHGPIVMDATGKAGPVVFAHYFGTPYVRQKQKPYYSRSAQQETERNLFQPYAKAYGYTAGYWRDSFKPVAYSYGKYLHTFLISALLRNRKSGQPVTVLPTANGIHPFNDFSLTQDANNFIVHLDDDLVNGPNKYAAFFVCDTVANVGANVWGQATINPNVFPKYAYGPPGQVFSFWAFAFESPAIDYPFNPVQWNAGICASIVIT